MDIGNNSSKMCRMGGVDDVQVQPKISHGVELYCLLNNHELGFVGSGHLARPYANLWPKAQPARIHGARRERP